MIFTAHKRSFGQGNIFTGVCLSNGGVANTPYPDTPPGQTPPGRPPWADIPPKETTTEAGGTHPTGMHSCFCILDERFLKLLEGETLFVPNESMSDIVRHS